MFNRLKIFKTNSLKIYLAISLRWVRNYYVIILRRWNENNSLIPKILVFPRKSILTIPCRHYHNNCKNLVLYFNVCVHALVYSITTTVPVHGIGLYLFFPIRQVLRPKRKGMVGNVFCSSFYFFSFLPPPSYVRDRFGTFYFILSPWRPRTGIS
jgi:hypothetical protein